MSLNPAAGGQICPNCGAPNSALSIFCAECGTSLSSAQVDDEQDNVGQTTVSFAPVSDEPGPGATSWEAANDSQSTQEFTPQSPDADSTSEHAVSTWQLPEAHAAPYAIRPPESRRGFVLGLIAAILIVMVIGFFIWSSIVGQGFRDSITGLF